MPRGLFRFVVTALLATVVDVAGFVVVRVATGWPVVVADAVALAAAAGVSLVLHRAGAARDDPYVRWITDSRAFVGIGFVAAVADLAVVTLLAGLFDLDGGDTTAFTMAAVGGLLAIKIPAVVVAGLVRVAGHRRVLHATVRHDQELAGDRSPAPGARRLSVVLPAFDEGEQVGRAVTEVRAALEATVAGEDLEIIVVDDGSNDDTADRARAAGADQVLAHSVNRGKGAAVRAGMLAAGGRARVFTDTDLSYAPAQILSVLAALEEGWDVVVGSRRHDDTTTLVRAGRLREFGGRAINVLTQLVLLGQYRDTQCGLKGFRADAADRLFAAGRLDGFAFDVELFHLVERYRLSLTEIPVEVRNSDRSSVHVARDAARLVRDLIRVRAWAEAGVYDQPTGAGR